jgi:hypothetical protein
VLLAVALALVGFPLGTTLAGRFIVPAGSGLAGPAIAVSYGLFAVATTTVVSAVLARYLERRSLVTILYCALGGALLSIFAIGIRILQLRSAAADGVTP